MTDPESVESYAQEVEGKFGSPDLLGKQCRFDQSKRPTYQSITR